MNIAVFALMAVFAVSCRTPTAYLSTGNKSDYKSIIPKGIDDGSVIKKSENDGSNIEFDCYRAKVSNIRYKNIKVDPEVVYFMGIKLTSRTTSTVTLTRKQTIEFVLSGLENGVYTGKFNLNYERIMEEEDYGEAILGDIVSEEFSVSGTAKSGGDVWVFALTGNKKSQTGSMKNSNVELRIESSDRAAESPKWSRGILGYRIFYGDDLVASHLTQEHGSHLYLRNNLQPEIAAGVVSALIVLYSIDPIYTVYVK